MLTRGKPPIVESVIQGNAKFLLILVGFFSGGRAVTSQVTVRDVDLEPLERARAMGAEPEIYVFCKSYSSST